MYQKKMEIDIRCPLEYGIGIMAGKWRSRIICMLSQITPLRYRDIKENLVNITDGVLSTNLNELITEDIIRKTNDLDGNMIEYELTEKGKQMVPFMKELCRWSGKYYKEQNGIEMPHCLQCNYYRAWKNQVSKEV